MATVKCKKAVKMIVENHGNISKSMREAGYTNATAKNPKNLTESKGFKEVCEEYGLTESLLLTALIEDIKKKPQNRKAELELGFKIRGDLIDKKDITSNGEKIEAINYINPNGDNIKTNNQAT